ncbi:MAG: hypothetical protein ABS52_07815 [Gemmatimonadetes bacterium SCN 70-22]|nr:MAG: hypothetical protein ABS52_07815 [Gemmatimonadetes bacterium SCN 70-22]
MSAKSLRYQLRFHSDWHIGSGFGRPKAVDRLVLRHAQDDLPYVPGKSITGVWREACEVVARGLDEGNDGAPWQVWLATLFGRRVHGRMGGRPSAKRIRIGAARFDDAFRQALVASPAVRETLTHVVPGVEIDERTGRAMDQQLRFIEMTRAGAILVGDVEFVELDDGEAAAAMALLRAGATWVEAIGGKRRRGAGRCDLELLEAARPGDIAVLKGPPPKIRETSAQFVLEPSANRAQSSGDAWISYDLTLDATTPLVIADRAAGNIVQCLPYIPGSLLLPAILQRLRRAVDGLDTDAAARRGDVIVTNATVDVGGTAGRPIPRSLVQDKKDPDAYPGLRNRLLEKDDDDGRPMEAPSRAFVGRWNAGIPLPWQRPLIGTTTHSVIDEVAQRPTADVGGVYTYEWLHPGTRLRAQLRIRASLMADEVDFKGFIDGQIRVGRAWDEYGAVTVNATRVDAANSELSAVARDDDELYVWLVSDLLLDDDTLAPASSELALRAALEDALDARLHPRSAERNPNGRDAMLGPARRESWATAWGLPRASLLGISAGSVAAYSVRAKDGTPLDAATRTTLSDRLSRVMASGLGARRGEGFGQVRFNDPMLTSKVEGLARSAAPESESDTPEGRSRPRVAPTALSRALERRAWRDAIDRAARAVVPSGSAAGRARGKAPPLGIAAAILPFTHEQPGSAQLGALRTVLAHATRADNENAAREVLKAWCDAIANTLARAKNWEALLSTLQRLIGERDAIWSSLGLDDARLTSLSLDAESVQPLKSELWVEALQTFVLQAIRQRKGPKPGGVDA